MWLGKTPSIPRIQEWARSRLDRWEHHSFLAKVIGLECFRLANESPPTFLGTLVKRVFSRKFPGGSVARILHFHCREDFDPWLRNKDPSSHVAQPKTNNNSNKFSLSIGVALLVGGNLGTMLCWWEVTLEPACRESSRRLKPAWRERPRVDRETEYWQLWAPGFNYCCPANFLFELV